MAISSANFVRDTRPSGRETLMQGLGQLGNTLETQRQADMQMGQQFMDLYSKDPDALINFAEENTDMLASFLSRNTRMTRREGMQFARELGGSRLSPEGELEKALGEKFRLAAGQVAENLTLEEQEAASQPGYVPITPGTQGAPRGPQRGPLPDTGRAAGTQEYDMTARRPGAPGPETYYPSARGEPQELRPYNNMGGGTIAEDVQAQGSYTTPTDPFLRYVEGTPEGAGFMLGAGDETDQFTPVYETLREDFQDKNVSRETWGEFNELLPPGDTARGQARAQEMGLSPGEYERYRIQVQQNAAAGKDNPVWMPEEADEADWQWDDRLNLQQLRMFNAADNPQARYEEWTRGTEELEQNNNPSPMREFLLDFGQEAHEDAVRNSRIPVDGNLEQIRNSEAVSEPQTRAIESSWRDVERTIISEPTEANVGQWLRNARNQYELYGKYIDVFESMSPEEQREWAEASIQATTNVIEMAGGYEKAMELILPNPVEIEKAKLEQAFILNQVARSQDERHFEIRMDLEQERLDLQRREVDLRQAVIREEGRRLAEEGGGFTQDQQKNAQALMGKNYDTAIELLESRGVEITADEIVKHYNNDRHFRGAWDIYIRSASDYLYMNGYMLGPEATHTRRTGIFGLGGTESAPMLSDQVPIPTEGLQPIPGGSGPEAQKTPAEIQAEIYARLGG